MDKINKINKIELQGVSKAFGKVQAVKNIDLTFEQGKVYGLLGRNGAGKSTLLNIITGRIFSDCGSITIDGESVPENDRAMNKIYHMGEKNCYPDTMRIREAFYWGNRLYPNFDLENANYLAEEFSLNVKQRVKELSTGMSSMFRLAIALSSGTPYVFLDEPVLGLDAVHREQFYRLLVRQFEKKPACYIISTHLIEEAAGIIEDVIIIKKGEILLCESTENLLERGYTVAGTIAAVDAFVQDKDCIGQEQLGGLKSAYILEKLEKSQVPEGLEITKLNLQQLFVQLTKE